MHKFPIWGSALALALVSLVLMPLQLLPGADASLWDNLLFALRDIGISVLTCAAMLQGAGMFANRLIDRSFWAAAMLFACLMASSTAFAQAATSTDLSTVGNQVIELVFAAIAGVVTYLVKRAVVALEGLHILQTDAVHGSAIDDAVTAAVAFAQSKLEALVDPKLRMTMTNSILAEAAQLVATTAPNAIVALNLSPASVQAKIQLALGDPLAVTDAPPPAAPIVAPTPVATVTLPGTLPAA